MFPLVASQLKLAGFTAFLLFSGVAIPTSIIAVNSDVRNSIKEHLKPVKTALEGIPDLLKNNVWEPSKTLWSQYVSWHNSADFSNKFDKDGAEKASSHFPLAAQFFSKAQDYISSNGSQIAQKAESFNYYLFHFSGLIKKVLSYIPRIPVDTIVSMINKQHSMQGLINIKKLISLSESHGKKKMVAQLMTLYSKKTAAFEKLKTEDIGQLFEVIKGLDETNVDTLWEKIEQNAKAIENDSSKNYDKEGDSIMNDLLINPSDKASLSQNINSVKGEIDSIESDLETAGLTKDQISSFKQLMENLASQYPSTTGAQP